MMKKTIAILLSLVMILGLAACGNSASQTEPPSTEDTSVESNADTESAENGTDMENMEQYDIVFIGYPIWWGEAPRIVSTFVESYDFSGKTIVPFCTSGGSGMGSSAANLEQLTTGAQWLSGERLSGSDSQDEVMEWVNGLGLNFEE